MSSMDSCSLNVTKLLYTGTLKRVTQQAMPCLQQPATKKLFANLTVNSGSTKNPEESGLAMMVIYFFSKSDALGKTSPGVFSLLCLRL